MKSRFWMCFAAIGFCAAVAAPLGVAAQGNRDHHQKHHHYKLIDVGTFGGPNSGDFPLWLGTLNRRGVNVGWSATSAPTSPTSTPLICGGLDGVVPFITHTFQWEKGVVTDLGSLAGAGYCSEPFWINDRGEIVGASENGQIDPIFGINQSRPVLWKDGEITDLGSLGGYEGAAGGINNRGQIAGDSFNSIPDPYCFFGSTQIRAVLWQHGQMLELGTLGGNCSSAFFAGVDAAVNPINERGQIVGISTTSTIPNPVTGVPPWDPFLWEEGKGMIDLGTLGGAFGGAQGINNHGQVIGQSSIAADPGACNGFPDNGDNNCHPFLWDQGKLTDLNTSSTGGNPQFVAQINDAGEIVGSGAFPNAPFEAFLWRKGVATDLGHLGGCYSQAQAINSESQVVGGTVSCDGTILRAFLWERGSMVDLNTLIPPGSSLQLANVEDINDRGEIDGIGVPPGVPLANFATEGHGFLLIPCDEHHPGVKGCDYRLADETSAARVSPPPATQHPAALTPGNRTPTEMLNRFRFPWGRPISGFGAGEALDQKQEPSADAVANDLEADHTPAPCWPPWRCHHGYCEVDPTTGKLTGSCVGRVPPLLACLHPSPNCIRGKKAIHITITQCGEGFPERIDLARKCTFR
jgi:probable HAF family extracellular repeat protein